MAKSVRHFGGWSDLKTLESCLQELGGSKLVRPYRVGRRALFAGFDLLNSTLDFT